LNGFFLYANEPQERPKLPLSQSLPYLQTIEHDALILGEGPTKVYVFVDPYCPNSRNFLSLIDENSKMRSKYTYYFSGDDRKNIQFFQSPGCPKASNDSRSKPQ